MYLEGCRSTSKLFKVLDSLLDEKLCSFENILEALLLVESVRDLTHIRRRTDIAFQRLNTKWSQTKCIAPTEQCLNLGANIYLCYVSWLRMCRLFLVLTGVHLKSLKKLPGT